MRQHFLHQTLELPSLIPGRNTEQNVSRPGIHEGLQLLDALLRRTQGYPVFHHFSLVVHRVVLIQIAFGLLKRRLSVFVYVDILIKGARESFKATAVIFGVPHDAAT